jgi:hypothetical protein
LASRCRSNTSHAETFYTTPDFSSRSLCLLGAPSCGFFADFRLAAGCFFGANGGRSEIDTLVGGVGNDIFQLGWSSGRFYDDANAANAGRTDYVLITDFTPGQDKVQLDGAAANYYLGASGVTGVSGIGLWAEQGTTDKLIAINPQCEQHRA